MPSLCLLVLTVIVSFLQQFSFCCFITCAKGFFFVWITIPMRPTVVIKRKKSHMHTALIFLLFCSALLLPQYSQTECAAFMGQGVSSRGRYPNGLNASQVHTHNTLHTHTHTLTHAHIMSLCLAGSFVFPVPTSFPISPTVKSLVVFFCVRHRVELLHRVMVQVV